MPLSLVPPTLPEDYCDLTQQEQANLLISGTQVIGISNDQIVFSIAEPSVNDRDKAWGKMNADVTYSNEIYKYIDGQWGAQNLITASGDDRIIWTGSEADLWSKDGGDGSDPSVPGNVTDYVGAMWERDTAFDGRSPMGVGDIPSTTGPVTVALGDDYGVGEVTLTSAQTFSMQDHQHVLGRFSQLTNDDGNFTIGGTADPYTNAGTLSGRVIPGGVGASVIGPLSGHAGQYMITSVAYNPSTSEPVTGIANVAHQNVHPVRVVFFAKRTARIFYTP